MDTRLRATGRMLPAAACALLVATACSRTPPPGRAASAAAAAGDGANAATVAAPASVPLPVARTPADRARWRERLQWPDECEHAFEVTDVSGTAGLVFHAFTGGGALVEVRCAAGAYQPSALVVRVDDVQDPQVVDVLTFTTYTASHGAVLERLDTHELWGELSFADPFTLSVLSLSRQTGDCGTWTEYTLADGRPRVVALHARLPCPDPPEAPVDPPPGRPPDGWQRRDAN